jgi:cytochrome c oxidase subunit II
LERVRILPAIGLALLLCALSALVPRSAAAAPGDGARAFEACAPCHGARGQGDPRGAPNIGGMDAWYVERQLRNFRSGVREEKGASALQLGMIAAARALADDAAVHAMSEQVAALPRAPGGKAPHGDVREGKNYFNAICSACHGGQGQGSAALSAPRLAGIDAEYLLRQLTAFRNGARGANPADLQGAQMRRIVLTLPGPATDRNLAAYLGTLDATAPAGRP